MTVRDINTARTALQACISDIGRWCLSRRLQLNAAKTELIWFGSRQMIQKLNGADLSLQLDSGSIHPVTVVRDLGVTLDSQLSMKQHISKVAAICFSQLRRLRQLRHLVGQEVTSQLVSAFILSRLDYCNAVLANLPLNAIDLLQRVQNAAARLVLNIRPRDHVTPALQQLHWLPVNLRITYKLCLMMHNIHHGHAPSYLRDSVTPIATATGRSGLRSRDTARYVKAATMTKFGERCFSFAGPEAWNSLPAQLHSVSDCNSFKKQLKTVLFDRAFK